MALIKRGTWTLSHHLAFWLSIGLVVAVVFGAVKAHSQTVDLYSGRHGSSFEVLGMPGAGAKIINIPPHEIDADKDQAWVAFCKPTIEVDKYGVERYRYAHEGCEFGRTQ
jgi:hypothetical protein